MFARLRAILGPWEMLYVVTVSLTALFLMLWVLSGNGAGWAVLVILAVGLPGSLFAAVLGAVVEISVLATVTLVASVVPSESNPVVAVRADSGLSPVGYLLWTFVWLIYVAVITAQAVAARLLIQKLGRPIRRPAWCLCERVRLAS